MSDHMALLQAKTDAISVELAKFESDKANLEVAQRAGAAPHGSSVKLSKLKAKIKGAKLRLSNAEKKLQEALAKQVVSPQQESLTREFMQQESSSDTPGFSEYGRMMGIGPNQSQATDIPGLGPMIKDIDGILTDKSTQDVHVERAEGSSSLMTQSNIVAPSHGAEMLTVHSAAATPTTGPASPAPTEAANPPPLHAVPQLDAKDTFNISPNHLIYSPALLPSSGVSPSLILSQGPVDPDISEPSLEIPESQAAQVVPPSQAKGVSADVPNSYHSIEGSDSDHPTFKRLNLSESDNEDDPMSGMNLMTAEDKVQLQRLLFKAGFTKSQPPKKRVKYVEVSDNSDGTGDPGIFDDDEDSELTNDQPSKAGHAKLLPSSKGKEREKKSKSKKETEERLSKGEGRKKAPKGGKKTGEETSKGENGNIDASTATEERPREGYSASVHSTAKAARVTTTLSKRRERLADEEGHRRFVEAWLNAPTATQRPEFPHGMDLIRTNPDYLPVVATINYRLTLELMLNQTTNFLCLPHVKLDRKLVSHVDNLEGPIRIWGTPFPRNQNTNIHSNISRRPHHFHCGCNEKVALAGFVMWKTWKVKAMINGQLVVEGLHQRKPFQPREVLFILQFLKSKFGYTVEDMFTGAFDEEEELRKEAQVMKKVANFCARRHFELIGEELTLDNNIEILEEDLVPEWI